MRAWLSANFLVALSIPTAKLPLLVSKETLHTGPNHNLRTNRKIVRIYNPTSGSYFESDEMDEGVVDQYVFSLAGG